ncbi:replication-relaxation family protein [Lentzea sp. JNUCC 0626]|uniref:replication-relaxation family protein n=1 Tax=Lentzea sp. JNUCC 0626 TaxID=3367513 RepID=UPI00374871F9
MITNPTRQRALRGHSPARPPTRSANNGQHQAMLASRLTSRDKWIARMLWEHGVLTSHQITAMAFPSFRSGRLRLRELYLWGVVDRFQPFVTVGTAPMHYVLGTAGASVLAAEDGLDVKEMGYRHDRALGIAYSLRLAHTVGVNEWFAALVERARHPGADERAELLTWWSEARCAKHFGDLVKPDGYGRWEEDAKLVEWFLEYDFGTESLTKLARKLIGYHALADATGITTPLLIWLPTSRREAAARTALKQAWDDLRARQTVPVATAAAELLDPASTHPGPADAVWLPLGSTAGTARRLRLVELARPVQLVPDPDDAAQAEAVPGAPSPMPPAPTAGTSARSVKG